MRPRQPVHNATRKAPLRATSHYTVPNYHLTRRIERSTAAPFARAARTPWHGATAADHCAEQLGPWCTAAWSCARRDVHHGVLDARELAMAGCSSIAYVEQLVLVPCAAP